MAIKNRSLLFLSIVAVVLILPGCDKEKDKREVSPVKVHVATVGQKTAEASPISYSGTIRASQSINLSFQVSGTVERITVEMGDFVEKGDLLAKVDETVYRETYNTQLAQAEQAEDHLKRVRAVYEKGSIAEVKMVEARSNYKQAKSAAEAAYQNVKHTRLHAPSSGYIGSKHIEVGDVAGPGQPVLTLLDISSVKAEVPVPDKEINRYQEGDSATVSIPALNDEILKGTINEVSVVSNRGNPLYTVKVMLPNPKRRLKPGMVCNVFIEPADSSITVPKPVIVPVQAVLVDEHNNRFVYTASEDGNKAVRKTVRTGELYNNGIAITEGLTRGDLLIVDGYHKLTDNSPIEIIREKL